jgi:hypothetical protein
MEINSRLSAWTTFNGKKYRLQIMERSLGGEPHVPYKEVY